MANELRKILSYTANDIDKLLQNGIYSIETEEEKNSLPLSIKTANRTVYVRQSKKIYVWNGTDWDEASLGGGIETLVGTSDKPISIYDLQPGLYLLTGYIIGVGNRADKYNNTSLTYRSLQNNYAIMYNTKWQYNSFYSTDFGNLIINFNNNGYSHHSHIMFPTDINGGLIPYQARIYAPTTVSTAGQILQSNGSGAPTWADPSTLGFATTADIEAAIGNVSALLGNTDDLEG